MFLGRHNIHIGNRYPKEYTVCTPCRLRASAEVEAALLFPLADFPPNRDGNDSPPGDLAMADAESIC